LANYREISLKS